MFPPDLAQLDFVPPTYVGRAASFVLGVVGVGLGGAAAAAAMLLEARALAARQAHEHDFIVARSERPLHVGPGRVVHGVVETEDNSDVAVRVEITQVVSDRTGKGEQWHFWNEVSRGVRAAPFYLVQDGGEVVYAQPDDAVLVVDMLETEYPQDRPRERLRCATVPRGARVHAYGDLHAGRHARAGGGAYRSGAGIGLVLRPPRGARMLLATDALEDRYAGRIAFLRPWSRAFALLWIVLAAVVNGPFVAASLFGRHEEAALTAHREYDTSSKGKTTTHHMLTVVSADGFALEAEVARPTYEAVVAADSGRSILALPIVRTGTSPGASFLGQASESGAALFVSWVLLGGALVMLALMYRLHFAWYDTPRLDERGPDVHWYEPRPRLPVKPGMD